MRQINFGCTIPEKRSQTRQLLVAILRQFPLELRELAVRDVDLILSGYRRLPSLVANDVLTADTALGERGSIFLVSLLSGYIQFCLFAFPSLNPQFQ